MLNHRGFLKGFLVWRVMGFMGFMGIMKRIKIG